MVAKVWSNFARISANIFNRFEAPIARGIGRDTNLLVLGKTEFQCNELVQMVYGQAWRAAQITSIRALQPNTT